MLPNTSRQRLLKLAELLDNLPINRFDYNRWVGDSWKGKADLSCGTTGCALGWATTIPSLHRLGLKLIPYDNDHGGYVGLIKDGVTMSTGEAAAMEVFGISYAEAVYLFNGETLVPSEFIDSSLIDSPSWDATPQQVAEHIKRFVKVKFPND